MAKLAHYILYGKAIGYEEDGFLKVKLPDNSSNAGMTEYNEYFRKYPERIRDFVLTLQDKNPLPAGRNTIIGGSDYYLTGQFPDAVLIGCSGQSKSVADFIGLRLNIETGEVLEPLMPSVSAAQIRLALFQAGFTENHILETIKRTGSEAEIIKWKYRRSFDRNEIFIENLGKALLGSAHGMDAVWSSALQFED